MSFKLETATRFKEDIDNYLHIAFMEYNSE